MDAHCTTVLARMACEVGLKRIFQAIDRDGNGILSPAELADFFSTQLGVGSVESTSFFTTADENKDGRITGTLSP